MANDSPDCARDLLHLIPRIMDTIRHGMRQRREDLSLPQFRTLALIGHTPGSSLADVASHVGLGAPAMSVLVDGLVRRGLILRASAPGDRRRVRLDLTPAGRAQLTRARAATRKLLAERLALLDARETATVSEAIAVLQRVFPETSTSASLLRQRRAS